MDELLPDYNSELAYLRELGAEFAARFPKVAARLQLEAGKCEDPHVERLLEGVALLTARVRRKLDDEYPEITNAFLEILYPQLLRPLPSMSIVQFLPGPDPSKLGEGHTIPAGTRLNSVPVDGVPCRFRTAYPATLWPVAVEAARLVPDRVVVPGKPPEAVALLQLTLRVPPGVPFPCPGMDDLRFYLDGEPPRVHALYELLFNNTCLVLAQGQDAGGTVETVALPRGAIRTVGFEADEGMVPAPSRSFPGYRLLQEYFAFPEKFLFFDLNRLESLQGRAWSGSIEILIFLDRSPGTDLGVGPENFRLGCAPVVNLFPMLVAPISLDQTKPEYQVVTDIQRPWSAEIHAIEEVTSVSAFLDEPVPVEPFYSFRHEAIEDRREPLYWFATRRPSPRRNDSGTEIYLTFVDRAFGAGRPTDTTISIRALCTNRDLPERLPFGGDRADFLLEAPGPVARVRCLRKPTRTLRPKLGRATHWTLISQLSLNHLSLVDSEAGLDAFRTLLRQFDWADSAVTRQQIHGLTKVSSRRTAGRTGRTLGNAACLGVEVTLEFDETQFVGSGVFLLASVLERFLGMYASINSFSQLVARTRQREGTLKRWPPRAGDRTLL